MDQTRKRMRDPLVHEPLLPDEDRYFEHYENYKIRMQLKKGIKVLVSRTFYIIFIAVFLILLVCLLLLVWQVIVLSKGTNSETTRTQDSKFLQPDKLLKEDISTEVNKTCVSDFKLVEPWKNLRLPRDILPVHYDLIISPDFKGIRQEFYGNVMIELKVQRETNLVLLHTKDLNITKVSMKELKTDRNIVIEEWFEYARNDYLVIRAGDVLNTGLRFSLHITFNGLLSEDKLYGLYKSAYTNTDSGARRQIVATKFEPVSARMAFPCFDEPNLKAEFTIRVIHDEDYIALSNMPVLKRTYRHKYHDLLVTRFRRSMRMSTYLVCVIVCDFEYLETITESGVLLRVYATPDKKQQGFFALRVANHTLTYYEHLFDIKFPLSKLDLIALPDFEAGAMENWGLITFRESTLLYDEEEASSEDKQHVAMVIAHELVHQWFGNLVTMDTWDHVWLNEGFAKYMEYLGVMEFEPEWKTLSQFLVRDYQAALDLDAGQNSHPIVFPVQDPNELNVVFDVIEYKKAASIIRMLQSFLGKDRFFQGIRNYLKRNDWNNADTQDLWLDLSRDKDSSDVKTIMDTWTNQMGYPLINVSLSKSANQTIMHLTQTRCLSNSDLTVKGADSPFGLFLYLWTGLLLVLAYKWYISVDYRTSEDVDSTTRLWMNMTNVDVAIPSSRHGTHQWIKLNSNSTGFYRVNYPAHVWKNLAILLEKQPEIFGEEDKFGLLNDAFYLAQYGYLNYGTALDLTLYIQREKHYLPWAALSKPFSYIREMLRNYPVDYKLWKKYVTQLARPLLTSLEWKDTGTHLEKFLRSELIRLTCSYDDIHCLTSATTMYEKWLQSEYRIPANLREHVYVYGARHKAKEEEWNQMWRMYKTGKFPQEKRILQKALANVKDEKLLHRYLMLARSESNVPSQDFFDVLMDISRNPHGGKSIAKKWLIRNWDYLVERFSLFSKDIARAVSYIFGTSNTEDELTEMMGFFHKYPDAGAGARGRIQAIEMVKSNIKWIKKNKQTIVDWLNRRT